MRWNRRGLCDTNFVHFLFVYQIIRPIYFSVISSSGVVRWFQRQHASSTRGLRKIIWSPYLLLDHQVLHAYTEAASSPWGLHWCMPNEANTPTQRPDGLGRSDLTQAGWGAGSAHTSGPINKRIHCKRTTLNARRCRWNCDRLLNVQRKNDTIKTGNFSAASSWRNLCIGNVKNTTLCCSVITVLICTQWQTNSCGWLIELQSYKRNWINMARVGGKLARRPVELVILTVNL